MERSFFSSASRPLAGFLGQLGLLDLFLKFRDLVAAVLAVAELLLNGLHLLIQIVLALGLLHLPLHAGPDAFFHLQNGDFALHHAENAFKPLGNGNDAEDFLLFRDLDRQMGGNRVCQLGIVVDLVDRAEHFRRNLLVQFHVVLELGNDRARQGLHFDVFAVALRQNRGRRLEIVCPVGIFADLRARAALHQNLDRVVGQLEKLQHGCERTDIVDLIRVRIVVRRIHLGCQKNMLVGGHHLFQRLDRLFAADKKRHDHVREDNDIAQGQYGIDSGAVRIGGADFCVAHFFSFLSVSGPHSVKGSQNTGKRLSALSYRLAGQRHPDWAYRQSARAVL